MVDFLFLEVPVRPIISDSSPTCHRPACVGANSSAVGRRWTSILAVLLLLVWGAPTYAAPVLPDVPEAHWARDAVASLVARGVVEGYPDGTWKGDRATTRWEVAILLARVLARAEQDHATFATRTELDEVQKLATALREELEALGVRTTALEQSAARLDRRVAELERITFYGSVDARFVAQAFTNTGVSDNDNGRAGGGRAAGVPYVDYNSAVGSAVGPRMRPQTHGVLPVVDYQRGRALTNGAGFTSRAILGLKVKVSADLDAGAEFAAYTSQGDGNVDGYWGVNPPFLSSPTGANAGGGGAQPLNNQPYTRLTLDNFWVRHNPSKTRLLLGAVEKTRLDPLIFLGQSNLCVYGPPRLPGYGFDVTGESALGTGSVLEWEALGTRTGSGNVYQGTNYLHQNLGATLGWKFSEGQGLVRANFIRNFDEAPAGGPLVVGLVTGANVRYGASTGWNTLQWVNPPGHFAAQRSAIEQGNPAVVGGVFVPNTIDTRPIPGWNSAADNALGITTGGGNFGPQDQTMAGLSARYEWKLEGRDSIRVRGEWAHSDFKSSRNSSYSTQGQAVRLELGGKTLQGNLDLSAFYLNVDPDYGPMSFSSNLLGLRSPTTYSFAGRFHLHDFKNYPHNREGFGIKGKWSFDQGRGDVALNASWLEQTRTSLYDVRALPGSAGLGAPNYPVLGFSPGYIDYIFSGYAHPLQYGANSGSSFDDALQALEDVRGQERGYGLAVSHRWEAPKVGAELSYNRTEYDRPSALPANFGGSQNQVDLGIDSWHLGANWDLTDRWTLLGGVDRIAVRGHHDPAGLYNSYAVANQSVGFVNVDSTQTVPSLGAQFRMAKDALCEVVVSHYDTRDGVPTSVTAGRGADTRGATAHDFNWEGWQIQTHFQMKF